VQRQVVGRGAQRVQRQQLDAERRREIGGDVRIVREEAHVERAGALRDFLADPAQPHEAERLPTELGSEKALLLPPSGLHRQVGRRDPARERQHQRHGVLGHADAVGARRVDHQHALRAGGGDVDVVHAGSRARHDPKTGRSRQEPGVDLRGAADDQRIRVRQVGRQVGRRSAAAGVDDPVGVGPQEVQRGTGELVRDDDFHGTAGRCGGGGRLRDHLFVWGERRSNGTTTL
jgi:hypothetical protein